jgi:hypothetical protein
MQILQNLLSVWICSSVYKYVLHKVRSVYSPHRTLTAWRHDPMERPSDHTIPGKLPSMDCWWEQCGKLNLDIYATWKNIQIVSLLHAMFYKMVSSCQNK